MKKKILVFVLLILIYSGALKAQSYTSIPDPNFEQALIEMGIDAGNIDGRVLTSSIESLTYLYVISKNIDDLTGIQDFRGLRTLNCANNNLTNIDISNNAALTTFDCSSNQLANLNIAANSLLNNLNCSNNKLTSLNVSQNRLLKHLSCASNQLAAINTGILDSLLMLNCSSNQLTAIDLTANRLLTSLLCASNQLETLALGANDSLIMIDCSNNQLTSLNVTDKIKLTHLTCSSNQIASIDLSQNSSLVFLDIGNNLVAAINLSNNPALLNLICTSNLLNTINLSNNRIIRKIDLSSNLIRDLDLSNNDSIRYVDCSNNALNSLNGNNNHNQAIEAFIAVNNPFLRCIIVDDPNFSASSQAWKKDTHASYKLNCISYTFVPDDNFESALSIYDDIPGDNYVPTSSILSVLSLEIDNQNIDNLTGIEDFINLQTLNCSHNQLYNLDISNLPDLINLDCSFNNLVDLNLRNGSPSTFTTMDSRNNPDLSCIQVDNESVANSNPGWQEDAGVEYHLSCVDNKTYIPDDNFEAALIEMGYDNGSLDNYVVTDSIRNITNLDIRDRNIFDLTGIEAFEGLDTLDCSKNKLNTIDISTNANLISLNCSENYLTNLNVENATSLVSLSSGDNKLSNLDVSNNTGLQKLMCNGNYLKNIDLTANLNLQELNCNSNLIANLNISPNERLKKVFCANNKILTLDLANNDSILELDCAGNLMNALNLQNLLDIDHLNCSGNNLANLDLQNNTELVDVKCNSNQIAQLDFTNNPLLRILNCSNNKLTTISFANNDSVRQLFASNNRLTEINLDEMIFLDTLNISDNQIESLNCTNNDSICFLLCSNNRLQSIDVSQNLQLRTLRCDHNALTELDVSTNNLLVELNCSNNFLEGLNLSNAIQLKELIVDYNQLEILDIGVNVNLNRISCSTNNLLSLDFNNLDNLTSINCSSNKLTSLSIRNGNNGILETFYSTNNTNLRCIEIDNAGNPGISWAKDNTASYSENCHYGETYVPDDNFEAALSVIIGESSNNNDNYIPANSINVITDLNISNRSISDLTGLQDFHALTILNCSGNQISSLNVNSLIQLINLNCSDNQIDSLYLNNNTSLEIVNLSNNLIDKINLNSLTLLTSLLADHNSLLSLDLRFNTNLTTVDVSANQLITMHANNGNNPVLSNFNATGNPGLFCIEVDDPVQAVDGTGVYASWQVDVIVTFGDNCHYNETYVPDDAFEQALKDLGYDKAGPLDDYVPTERINKVSYLNISGKGISDLTGIEDFSALTSLNCSNNNLQNLDISNNLSLATLIGSSNNLRTLNTSQNIALQKLDISSNLLESLDISGNTGLERLYCSINQLRSLNILNNTSIIEVNCSSNQLLSVDANNGNNQTLLYFDLRNNPDLRCILVDDISASTGRPGWYKDQLASYKLVCDDDDNDGVIDSEDQCLDTPFGDFVDVFGCSVFMLPADNFMVQTKSETCRDGNNGMVIIIANELYNYTATLTGTLDTVISAFTNDIEIRNLRADTYDLCITIDDKPGYSQCYQVVITQPDEFNVTSKMDQTGKIANFKMSGGSVYSIDFNGRRFSTSEQEINLSLENGKNTIQIMADAVCQGVYNETFFLTDGLAAFPNPFDDELHLYIGTDNFDKVEFKIFGCGGQLFLSGISYADNGLVMINTSGLKPGIYYAWIKTKAQESTIKIVRE